MEVDKLTFTEIKIYQNLELEQYGKQRKHAFCFQEKFELPKTIEKS